MKSPLIVVLALLAVAIDIASAKKVGFFTNFLDRSGSSHYDGEGVVQWLADAGKLAGRPGAFTRPGVTQVFYCCNAASITSSGDFSSYVHPNDYGPNLTAPLTAKGIDVWFVTGLDSTCVENECWKTNPAGLNQMISIIEKAKFTGWLVDFEPTTQRTSQVFAEKYAKFLRTLSFAMHGIGKKAGFCASNWGIIDVNHMPTVYGSSGVDLVSSMASYNYPGTMVPLENYLKNALGHIPQPATQVLSADVGTMLVPGVKPSQDFGWTPQLLQQWLSIVSLHGVQQVTAWRADIDRNLPASQTAAWFFQALADWVQ